MFLEKSSTTFFLFLICDFYLYIVSCTKFSIRSLRELSRYSNVYPRSLKTRGDTKSEHISGNAACSCVFILETRCIDSTHSGDAKFTAKFHLHAEMRLLEVKIFSHHFSQHGKFSQGCSFLHTGICEVIFMSHNAHEISISDTKPYAPIRALRQGTQHFINCRNRVKANCSVNHARSIFHACK